MLMYGINIILHFNHMFVTLFHMYVCTVYATDVLLNSIQVGGTTIRTKFGSRYRRSNCTHPIKFCLFMLFLVFSVCAVSFSLFSFSLPLGFFPPLPPIPFFVIENGSQRWENPVFSLPPSSLSLSSTLRLIFASIHRLLCCTDSFHLAEW